MRGPSPPCRRQGWRLGGGRPLQWKGAEGMKDRGMSVRQGPMPRRHRERWHHSRSHNLRSEESRLLDGSWKAAVITSVSLGYRASHAPDFPRRWRVGLCSPTGGMHMVSKQSSLQLPFQWGSSCTSSCPAGMETAVGPAQEEETMSCLPSPQSQQASWTQVSQLGSKLWG